MESESVDPVTDLVAGLRAHSAFTLRLQFDPPWGLDIRDGAALTVIAVLEGTARLDNGSPARELQAGDIAVVQGTRPYSVTDADGTPATLRIIAGNRCVDLAGRGVAESMSRGLRTWGNSGSGTDTLFVGVYQSVNSVGSDLLRALPDAFVVCDDPQLRGMTALMKHEMSLDVPGQRALLDRLLDVILIGCIRSYSTHTPGVQESALTTRDIAVAAALDLMHSDPSHAWTVETLARAVNSSRAALARRFKAAVGQAPIAYLTCLRLAIAADLILASDATIASISHRVGYASPFALSVAFKRRFGTSPSNYRSVAI